MRPLKDKTMKHYTKYQDPAHGWVRVPIKDVKDSGIYVSPFSYTDGRFVYLEEDCDATRFIRTTNCIVTLSSEDGYWIRSLQSFSQKGKRRFALYAEEDQTHYVFKDVIWACSEDEAMERLHNILVDGIRKRYQEGGFQYIVAWVVDDSAGTVCYYTKEDIDKLALDSL